MKNAALATVVLVCFNGKRYLTDCLSAVLDQSLDPDLYDIVVVDNGSTDGSPELVAESFPQVALSHCPSNLGFYGALNHVAQRLCGKYIVGVPQDTIVHRDWLEEMIKAAEDDRSVAVCLANTMNPTSPDFSVRRRRGPVQHVYVGTRSICGNQHIKTLAAAEATGPIPTLMCMGTSLLVRRDFLLINPFDTFFFHYGGDIEYGIRTNVLGSRMVLVPTAVIYHVDDGKSVLRWRLLQRYYCGLRNRVLLFYKNMTGAEFVLFSPLLVFGLAHKMLTLRVNPVQRILMFAAMLPVAPLVFLAALLNLPAVSKGRAEVLARRAVGRLWLLRCLLGRDPCVV